MLELLGQENPLEQEMATHSSILDQKIPWTEEPGGLQSMGSQRVGHDNKVMNIPSALLHGHSDTLHYKTYPSRRDAKM